MLGSGPSCNLALQPDVQALRAAGILPVFAAGNFGSGASSSASPANYPESYSVGAVGSTDLVRSDSSRGPSGCGGRTRVFPDLVAPGTGVLTLDRYGLTQMSNGTSIAAPHVAGALALLLGADPDLTPDLQAALLTGTAVDLGAAGADDTYGSGRLDVAAAYAAVPQPSPDYVLEVSPASATVAAAGSVTFQVTASPVDGFSGDIDVSVAGLPSGEGTAVVSPRTITGGAGTASLTVAADGAASGGVFALTVSAASGDLLHEAAVSVLIEAAPPPPADQLLFSTYATVTVPGLGDADDADVYGFDGSTFRARFDATAAGLPAGANIDGLSVVGPGHFFVSFAGNVVLPGLGKVQDEDVVELSDGVWRIFFDGTALGLTSGGADLDAISVRGDTLYFSTRGKVTVPGVYGTPDDADVYSWNGIFFAREWQAAAHGVPSAANLDGLVWSDPTSLAVSFATRNVRLPGLGKVQDEDVVAFVGSSWSMVFDGGAHGLDASDGLDIDAFDLG